MADDVKDIAIYDGNKWQSLSALAAEQVEAELPISSADDSVVLDSPSANTFSISTGGAERVKVEDAKTTFSGQIRNKTGSSTIAYLESTTDAAQVKLNSTNESWWIGPNNFGFAIFNNSQNQSLFVFDAAGNFKVTGGSVQTPSVSGLADNDASIALGAELLTSNHTPTQPNSIATKAYADTKAGLWTGTQAEYDALGVYDNQTLYCITD